MRKGFKNMDSSVKNIQKNLKVNKGIINLDEALEKVVLPDDEIAEIKSKEAEKSLREALSEITGGIGKTVKIFLDHNDRVKEEIKRKKEEILLEIYFQKTGDNAEQINKLVRLLNDYQGSILFNKILGILDDGTPNTHFIFLLASTLSSIINSDFERLFEQHKYALDRIGRLTPQALIILYDCENWSKFKIGNYASSSGLITSDWIKFFTPAYAKSRYITDAQKFIRISQTIKELLTDGLLQSRLPGQNDSKDYSSIKEADNVAIVEPTELGQEILSYLQGRNMKGV